MGKDAVLVIVDTQILSRGNGHFVAIDGAFHPTLQLVHQLHVDVIALHYDVDDLSVVLFQLLEV